MPALCIRADATARIGSGHVMRSLALAQGWHTAGGRVIFLGTIEDEGLVDILHGEGHVVEAIPQCEPGSDADALHTATLARKHGAQWILVDGYAFESRYFEFLKKTPIQNKILQIDDAALLDRYEADVVLNPNGQACPALYEGKVSKFTKTLLGSDYTLLRSQVLATPRRMICASDSDEIKIVTFFGASDPPNVTASVLLALDQISHAKPLRVIAVAGRMNQKLSELETLVNRLKIRVNLMRDSPQFHKNAVESDISVIAGGTTLQELAFLGVPTILISVAENQIDGCRHAEKQKYSRYAGHWNSLKNEKLVSILGEILQNQECRNILSENAKLVFDGRGVQRVVCEMF